MSFLFGVNRIFTLKEYGLYYDRNSGTYMTYNQDTNTYEFYSKVEVPVNNTPEDEEERKRKSKIRETKKVSLPLIYIITNVFVLFFDFQVNYYYSDMKTITNSFTKLQLTDQRCVALGT